MSLPTALRFSSSIIMFALAYVGLLVVVAIMVAGPRDRGPLTNIHGIPFPEIGSDTIITETLAHADIILRESVLAKQLTLTITFTPQRASHLALGIRQDPFWLSYSPITIYSSSDGDPLKTYTRTVTIPLTAVAQDRDRSIDMMMFADYTGGQEDKDAKDTTFWTVHNLTARVDPLTPTTGQLRQYIKSLVKRERPL